MTDSKRILQEIVSEEKTRKVFSKVFDNETIMALHKLARQNHFEQIEFLISAGKEAEVFRAVDNAGNYRVIKIYKTKVVEFRNLRQYIEHDIRFTSIRKDRTNLIYAWTKKEFRNLEAMGKAEVKVPMPLAFNKNILVMEFIGKNGEAAKTLNENPCRDLKKLKEFFIENIALMTEKAGLVHADLSEYNILNNKEELTLIDCGQAVLLNHPKAQEFFDRDIKNVAKYLSKQGLETSEKELKKEIKKKASGFSKK